MSEEQGREGGATGPRARILVVDDEPAVRHFLKMLLARMGYEVDTASGGAEGLSLVAQTPYDVVLTDLLMPRVDGLEVIRRTKEISPETEIVIITGYPSSETIVAATRAGAVDYLPKSPDAEHLAVLVEKAMEIRSLKRKAAERDFYLRMAQMDGLTELFNHRTFHGFLEREFARAKRSGKPLSLLFADVDDFKEFNSFKGHLFGDRVLKLVAGAMKENCRTYDIVARYGGDEFAVLAPETPKNGGCVLGERIVRAMTERSLSSPEIGHSVTLSIGVAAFPEDAESPEQLLQQADVALYAAKAQGKGRVA